MSKAKVEPRPRVFVKGEWFEKVKATRKRRKTQTCKSYELKIDKSHLSKATKNHLDMLFLEAKWFYNHILSTEDIFGYDTKTKKVIVLNKDGEPEERTLNFLSSQMRQGIKQRMCGSIKALSTLKKKGLKVGRLKYRSHVDSIALNQFGITFSLSKNGKRLRIQGLKSQIRINGYKQIPKNAEITNANLIRVGEDYFLKVTCFLPKEKKAFSQDCVGIDLGIKTTATLSNGEKFDIKIPESKCLKKIQRSQHHKVKGSKNRLKQITKLNKEYRKISNQKKDKKNKIVSYITNTFKTVVFQDENIRGWHKGFHGKEVQNSALGGIMSDLKTKSHTPIVVERFFPSTKLCYKCGTVNEIPLKQRVYKCQCGHEQDRDVHAANNILLKGLSCDEPVKAKIPTERRKSKPVEIETSTHLSFEGEQVSVAEAGSLSL